METDERHMLAFAILSVESRERQQIQGELRFLLMTGTASCRAGYAQISRFCYKRILKLNPHHMLSKSPSLEEALKSEDFRTLISRLDRFCTYEHAEMLLEKHRPGWESEPYEEFEKHCLEILKQNLN
ncbi:MAG: hypothetical protein HUJ26_23465 [Planctomycetaceae bacterium]|nr:hypothetical protein [Planctomycetaceae bacterium]